MGAPAPLAPRDGAIAVGGRWSTRMCLMATTCFKCASKVWWRWCVGGGRMVVVCWGQDDVCYCLIRMCMRGELQKAYMCLLHTHHTYIHTPSPYPHTTTTHHHHRPPHLGSSSSSARTFVLDTTPPQVTLRAQPQPLGAQAVALTDWGASDQSGVWFSCKLDVVGRASDQGNVYDGRGNTVCGDGRGVRGG